MIYFRCDVSETVGWGHFKRCLALAQSLQKFTQTCFLIPNPGDIIDRHVQKCGSALHALPHNQSYANEIPLYPDDCKNIILDLGHRQNLENPNNFLNYLNALNDQGSQIAMIDGLDDDSFRNDKAPKIKACIQPYWGVKENIPPHAEHWLYGRKYVLLDQIYENAYIPKKNTTIKNILITFGGSDPQENTLKIVQSLATDRADQLQLNIQIIIGPSFSKTHIERIEDIARTCPHMALIHCPQHLRDHYHWADLGIGGSSTTRYEAAACGLPMIFTAIYKQHINLSKTFASYGTAQYAGYCDDLTPVHWQNAIFSLLENDATYINMLKAIEKIQPSEFGTTALAKVLLEIFDLKKS